MVLLMARPTTRAGTQNAQFQRRVAANVLKVARGQRVALSLPSSTVGGEPIRMTVTLGASLRFSLRTDDKALRDMRHAAVIQQLEAAYAAILAGGLAVSPSKKRTNSRASSIETSTRALKTIPTMGVGGGSLVRSPRMR